MADYKDIVGTAVRNNAGNLSADQKDQIFYDSTNLDFKYQFEAVADSWRTTTPLNSARASGVMGGTKTSSWVAGGEMPTSTYPSSFTVYMELWNGSTWTEVNDLTTPKTWSGSSRGVPNNTTGLVFAGYGPPSPTGPAGGAGYRARTEEWNGSNWTEVGDVNTARGFVGGSGTSAEACLCFGGWNPPSAYALTELWNGSSWTETTDLNTARYGNTSFGSSTSALYMGTSPAQATESWNGSTWTEVADMTNADKNSGAGVTNTAGLAFGGFPEGHTERWNGSTWTETADFNTARSSVMGAGASSTSGIVAGGSTPSSPNNMGDVEEFSGSAPVGAWSSGGALNVARADGGGAGTREAAMFFGGANPGGASSLNELYGGATWTESNNMNTARSELGADGLQTAAIAAGGRVPSAPITVGNVEIWDGSSWTETTDMTNTRRAGHLTGTSTNALYFGGKTPGPSLAQTELWNGSSWTEVADLNTAREANGGAGIYTATVCFGGYVSPDYKANTENWNGSAWSEVADLNTARGSFSSIGTTSTAALAAGGYPVTNKNEDWNGISWQEITDLSTIRGNSEGAGTSTAGFAFGGDAPPSSTQTTATEEWSSTSTTINVLTD